MKILNDRTGGAVTKWYKIKKKKGTHQPHNAAPNGRQNLKPTLKSNKISEKTQKALTSHIMLPSTAIRIWTHALSVGASTLYCLRKKKIHSEGTHTNSCLRALTNWCLGLGLIICLFALICWRIFSSCYTMIILITVTRYDFDTIWRNHNFDNSNTIWHNDNFDDSNTIWFW